MILPLDGSSEYHPRVFYKTGNLISSRHCKDKNRPFFKTGIHTESILNYRLKIRTTGVYNLDSANWYQLMHFYQFDISKIYSVDFVEIKILLIDQKYALYFHYRLFIYHCFLEIYNHSWYYILIILLIFLCKKWQKFKSTENCKRSMLRNDFIVHGIIFMIIKNNNYVISHIHCLDFRSHFHKFTLWKG